MTCNAFRFGLSTIILAFTLPFIPKETIEQTNSNDNSDSENESEHTEYNDNYDNDNISLKITQNNVYFRYFLSFFSIKIQSNIQLLLLNYKKNVWFWGITLGMYTRTHAHTPTNIHTLLKIYIIFIQITLIFILIFIYENTHKTHINIYTKHTPTHIKHTTITYITLYFHSLIIISFI